MARYSNTAVSLVAGVETAIEGVEVYVYDQNEALAELEEDGGGALDNPVTTDEYGGFYFTAADGLYDLVYRYGGRQIFRENRVQVGEGPELPAEVLSALGADGGAAVIGTEFDRTLASILGGLAPRLISRVFPIVTIKAFGDSFTLQPNPHTIGNSMVKKYATLQGIASPTINGTSGYSAAEGQTAIFTAAIAATDHTIHQFGNNDASFLGTGTDKTAREADLASIILANLVWLGKAAGTNKIAAGSVDNSPTLEVEGTWTADPDLAGAFKATAAGAAQQATFTNTRYGVLLYKAKIGTTGKFFVKAEDDGTNLPIYSSAPVSGWVPTGSGQTWAVMAQVWDFGAVLPTAKLQVAVDATTGGGEVSIVGFVGFSGEVGTGPRLGVADVARRGSAGYATAAGSEVNVPIVNRLTAQAIGRAQALGIDVIDLPLASVIDASFGLAADGYHPSETGATAVAAAWKARMDSGAPLAGDRLDLLIQGILQNMGGEFSPGMVFGVDRFGRMRFMRGGGDSLDLTGNREIRHTTGELFVPIINGVPDPTKAMLRIGDGVHNYIQSLVGRLILKGATGDGLSIGPTDFRFPTTTVAALVAAGIAGAGARAIVTDANATTFASNVAAGGANVVPVYSDGTNWKIG